MEKLKNWPRQRWIFSPKGKRFHQKVNDFKNDFVKRVSDIEKEASKVIEGAKTELDVVKQQSEAVKQEMKAALNNFNREAAMQALGKIGFIQTSVIPSYYHYYYQQLCRTLMP